VEECGFVVGLEDSQAVELSAFDTEAELHIRRNDKLREIRDVSSSRFIEIERNRVLEIADVSAAVLFLTTGTVSPAVTWTLPSNASDGRLVISGGSQLSELSIVCVHGCDAIDVELATFAPIPASVSASGVQVAAIVVESPIDDWTALQGFGVPTEKVEVIGPHDADDLDAWHDWLLNSGFVGTFLVCDSASTSCETL